jgi:hypothetical protein
MPSSPFGFFPQCSIQNTRSGSNFAPVCNAKLSIEFSAQRPTPHSFGFSLPFATSRWSWHGAVLHVCQLFANRRRRLMSPPTFISISIRVGSVTHLHFVIVYVAGVGRSLHSCWMWEHPRLESNESSSPSHSRQVAQFIYWNISTVGSEVLVVWGAAGPFIAGVARRSFLHQLQQSVNFFFSSPFFSGSLIDRRSWFPPFQNCVKETERERGKKKNLKGEGQTIKVVHSLGWHAQLNFDLLTLDGDLFIRRGAETLHYIHLRGIAVERNETPIGCPNIK